MADIWKLRLPAESMGMVVVCISGSWECLRMSLPMPMAIYQHKNKIIIFQITAWRCI